MCISTAPRCIGRERKMHVSGSTGMAGMEGVHGAIRKPVGFGVSLPPGCQTSQISNEQLGAGCCDGS